MASFSDDFNRADSTNLGAGWVEWGDNWSIVGNQLAPGTATTGVILTASALGTPDHYAEVVMSTTTSGSLGVIARSAVDTGAFYLWRSSGSSWDLYRQTGGSFTPIGQWVAPLANGDVARIECVGSTIKGYVNGIERVSVTDTGIATGGYVGVRSSQSSTIRYDNFAAADISAVVDSDIGAFFDFLRE